MKKFLLFSLAILCYNNLFCQTLAHERCAAFEKGLNINNWLEEYWNPNWPTETGYSKSDFEDMKTAGISSIRLPIGFSFISDTLPPYDVDTNHVLFQRIDSVVKWTQELNLNLIIDNHHGWFLTNENWRSHKDRFAHLWGIVAKRYKNLDPSHYFFELMNEPPIAFNDLDSLNLLFNTAIDSIRKYTTEHTIIVSPNLGSWGMAFNVYQPLADTNLIYTFHCYDPLDFTHQGFTWHDPYYPTGTAFPTTGDPFYENFLYESWNRIADWKATYNKPLFLGEFGVGSYADQDSRCRWIEFIGDKIDSLHLSWFYWDWAGGFPMFQSNSVAPDSIYDCFKYSLHLYSDTVSGINESISSLFNEVKIYPNPASTTNALSIEVTNTTCFNLIIYDVRGRIIFENNIQGNTTRLKPNFERGIYVAEITSGSRKIFKKMVIK